MDNKNLRMNKDILLGECIAFIAAAICMFVVIKNLGYIDGEYSLIHGDALNIYIPIIKNLCRDIINGQSVHYTWHAGLGMNTILNNAFSAYSIANLLFLIPLGASDTSIVAILIVIKTGLAASAFYWYAVKSHDCDYRIAVIFSLFYSMCSFQISYNITNIIWMDALIILPLVFYSLDRLLRDKGICGLIICYTYIFITQFYMGYMIGMIGMLYFVCHVVIYRKERQRVAIAKVIENYVLSMVVAALVSAFVWVPVAFYTVEHRVSDATGFIRLKAQIPDIINQLFWRQLAGYDADVPNLYCGILTLILIVLFFGERNIHKEEKIIYGAMISFLLISCISDPLYIIWHGFDAPDGWTYRFSYILSFILCSVAAKASKDLGGIRVRSIVITAVALIVIFVSIMYLWYGGTERTVLIQNAACIFVWAALLIFFLRLKTCENIIVSIMLLLAISECILAYKDQPLLKCDMLADEYEIWDLTTEESNDILKKDAGFFRVNYTTDYCINSGMYQGYNTVSYFSSAENENLRKTLRDMGLYTTPRMVLGYGLTPVSKMLLDVKYDVHGVYLHQNMDEEELYSRIEENPTTLSLGYMIAGDVRDYDISCEDPFLYNNALLSLMTGNDIEVFEKIDISKAEIREKGLKLIKEEAGYNVVNDSEAGGRISFMIPCESKNDYYAYIDNSESIKYGRGFLLEGGEENNVDSMGELSVSYLKPMIRSGDKMSLDIVSRDNTAVQHIGDILFGVFNKEDFEKAYEQLKKEEFVVEEIKDGYIKGKVTVEDDRRLLLLSVPYDESWKVMVDGKQYEAVSLLNGAFLGVELPGRGDYELKFEYKTRGATLGLILALFGTFLFFVLIYKSNLKKN